MFDNIYKGKTVLVTGHTGFKGSWLSMWLIKLGAKVVGYSAYLPSEPCNFKVCRLSKRLTHIKGDIRDSAKLSEAFRKHQPDILFHLAAQPIVRRSYDEPKLTFDTNVGGTVNIMESIRQTPSLRSAVIITSDKCYKNVEWVWGYRETDGLGGDDPYSASKGCAEIVVNSYIKSFHNQPGNKTHIATTRAGNVIGGGDWATDRIIPDCVRAWSTGKDVVIRAPQATRPWQLVLEPLSGYLALGAKLYGDSSLHGEPFNFGPDASVNQPVSELIDKFLKHWGKGKWRHEKDKGSMKESMLLKLSCDKALHHLKWKPTLGFNETVSMTAEWYKRYYADPGKDMYEFTLGQIDEYVAVAKSIGQVWTEKEGA